MGGEIRMSEDDRSLLAMAAARMSPASIAGTMGWSERRVTARLATLKAEAEAATVVREDGEAAGATEGLRLAVASIQVLAVVTVGEGMRRLAAGLPDLGVAQLSMKVMAEAEPEVHPVAALAIPAPAPGEPVCKSTPWTEAEDRRLRTVWATTPWGESEALVRALDRTLGAIRQRAKLLRLGRMGQGLPVAPVMKRLRRMPVRPLEPMGERRGVEVLKPVTETRLRYCRWFHEAAWPVGEIAALFDVAEGELAQALGVIQ